MIVRFSDGIDLGKIVDSGQCFSCGGEDGMFWFLSAGRLILTRQLDERTIEAFCDETDWSLFWSAFFDAPRDYSLLRRQMKKKGGLDAAAAEEGAGLRVLRQDAWETLVSFIVSQRKSIPAIRGCLRKLSGYGNPVTIPPAALKAAGDSALKSQLACLRSLPSPEVLSRLTPEQLAGCGTGYRAAYLHDAAERVASCDTDLAALSALDNGALQDALMRIKGVGVKVADCVMLFAYGRTDAVPADVWIRRVMRRDPSVFEGLSDPGLAQQYLFLYARNHKSV